MGDHSKAPAKITSRPGSNLILFFRITGINQSRLYKEAEFEYLHEKVVGETSKDDCLHIALAIINKIDILVSWNFKHIVYVKRIRCYNAINIKNGYYVLEIRSPKELIDYEK